MGKVRACHLQRPHLRGRQVATMRAADAMMSSPTRCSNLRGAAAKAGINKPERAIFQTANTGT